MTPSYGTVTAVCAERPYATFVFSLDLFPFSLLLSWISSAGIVSPCAGRFTAGVQDFSLLQKSGFALGRTQPPIQLVKWVLSLTVRRPGREADHSLPSSAKVTNEWSYTSAPPVYLHSLDRHNSTFLICSSLTL